MTDNEIFLKRSDAVAKAMKVSLRELVPIIKLSTGAFFGYRNGKMTVSAKAWRKLELVEHLAGIETELSRENDHNAGEHLALRLQRQRPDGSTRMIPVIGWAHAGQSENYEELPKSWQHKIPTECRDVRAFAVALEGDSMKPEFYEGDKLIIQPSEEVYSGCYAVARFVDDGVVFRRLEMSQGMIRLIPLNERYPVTEHHPAEFSWIYPVWGMWRQIWKK